MFRVPGIQIQSPESRHPQTDQECHSEPLRTVGFRVVLCEPLENKRQLDMTIYDVSRIAWEGGTQGASSPFAPPAPATRAELDGGLGFGIQGFGSLDGRFRVFWGFGVLGAWMVGLRFLGVGAGIVGLGFRVSVSVPFAHQRSWPAEESIGLRCYSLKGPIADL